MDWFFRVLIVFIPLLVNGKEWLLAVKTVREKEISYDGFTQLMAAIEGGVSLEKVQGYIDYGADVNGVCFEFLRCYNPVLRYALNRGTDPESVAIIKALLVAGADVNQCTYNRVSDQNVYGFMPLISYAVIYSSSEVVQLFIEHGADVNQKLDTELGSKKTALTYAQELGKAEVAILLKEAGAMQN